MKIDKKEFAKAKMHYVVTPAESLRAIRELQGMSQNELSNLTDIAQSNISAIENGLRQLGRDRAIVFAKALRVHPAVLLFPDFDIAEAA